VEVVFRALIRAAANLPHPAVFAVLLVPVAVAGVLWLGLAWWFWDSWTLTVQNLLANTGNDSWLAHFDVSHFAGIAAAVLVVLLLAPAIIATAVLVAAVFAMPILVELVAKRSYPLLERKKGGTLAGSVWNAVVALISFAVLWVATLPAWLFVGPFALVIPLLLSAQLNQRLFRYDAIAEHASAEEIHGFVEQRWHLLFTLGIFTGLLYFVPVVNLIAPVYAALAFIHFGLMELEQARADRKWADANRLAQGGQ
jgi:CysZ protein